MSLNPEIITKLIESARQTREYARVPLSHFPIGAAILTREGHIFSGCNVELENILYSICAERTALVKMVSEGYKDAIAIAVIADADHPLAPCGQCRQALYDFNADMEVIMATTRSRAIEVKPISTLLPLAYQRPKS